MAPAAPAAPTAPAVRGRDGVDAARSLAVLLGPEAGRAERLGRELGLPRLARAGAAELAARGGLSRRGAERLAAAFALGRAVERARAPALVPLDRPARVLDHVRPVLRGLDRETFLVLLLDARHRLLRIEAASVGTLTSSLVHPREVFGPAVRESAAAVVCAHNHPSGDPEPSGHDLEVTRRLRAAGRLLGVPLLDHLVVAEGGHVSLRERLGSAAWEAVEGG